MIDNQLGNKVSKCNTPLLTISIPTYNRANHLDLCLKSILQELVLLDESKRELVRVLVSDNASTDNTNAVVSNYVEIHSGQFSSLRNIENMGMDFNFNQCYESAATHYVWLIGDDDILLPGGLLKVLDILSNYDVDILYVNNYWFKGEYIEKKKQDDDAAVFSIFTNPLTFSRKTNVMLTFLSGVIVRTRVGSNHRSEFLNSCLIQLSWVLPLLRDGQCFVMLENNVIAAKGGNSGGYGLVNVFGHNLKKITSSLLMGCPKVERSILNGTIVKFFPGLIMSFRNGLSPFDDKTMGSGLREVFGNNWRYYIFIAPLINLPLFFCRIYYYFIRFLAKVVGSIVI